MRNFLTGLFSCLFSMICRASGVTADTWQFWALFGILMAIIAVQYIDR